MRLRDRVSALVGGTGVYPLLVLFGLNAVDELDRVAFSVLIPNIRDHFDLGNTGATVLVAAILPIPLIFGIPIASVADRRRRVPIAAAGAATWAVFSVLTGAAWSVAVLGLARAGAGLGRAVNDPVHGSLLADYYDGSVRGKVFGVHRAANSVGAFFGPLAAGLIASSFGWRMPFFVLAVPTLVFVALALRMREPSGHARVETVPPRLREGLRTLWAVPTLRRIWLGVPFLAVAGIGVQFLHSIFYEGVFGVDEAGRGFIQAMDAPFIVAGLLAGMPLVDRTIARDPGRVMRRIGLLALGIAALVGGMAAAPELWMSVACAWATNALTVVLVAAGATVISLAAPPEVRARALALFGIFALAGVVTLPLVGWMMDTFGERVGLASVVPFLSAGALIVASSGRYAAADVAAVSGRSAGRSAPPAHGTA